ncbi:hypothetical protein QUF63_16915, partial [Anaerolineales bacterium HSG25]|nr:hypothetical protein [Anaerolineales bacterium HSG25]
DTTLARAAGKGFLTTLIRPDLADIQNFYLLQGVDIDSPLAELEEPITGFEILKADWVDGNTFQTEAILAPSDRTLIVYTGRHDNRWKVEGIELIALETEESSTSDAVIGGGTIAPDTSSGVAPINNGLSGTIAFQVHSGSDIYVIQADGTGLQKVTHGIDPELSPDGTKLAFTRWEPHYTLHTINIDGTGEQAWASNWRKLKSPSWSPDGNRLVFSYQRGGRLEEEYVEYKPFNYAKRGQTPPSVPRPVYDFEYDSTTGTISYKIPPNAYWHLQQFDLTSGEFVATASGNPYSYGPSFHPTDGNKIIFRGDKGLGLYDVAGQSTQAISHEVGDKAGVISPDGQKIALSFRQNNNWEIHVMNIDGSNRQQLTSTPPRITAERKFAQQEVVINENGYRTLRTTQGDNQPNADWVWNHSAPAWSLDGSKLLFMTNRTDQWEIWIMNADGSEQQPMFTNGALDGITLQYDGVDERMLSWR